MGGPTGNEETGEMNDLYLLGIRISNQLDLLSFLAWALLRLPHSQQKCRRKMPSLWRPSFSSLILALCLNSLRGTASKAAACLELVLEAE